RCRPRFSVSFAGPRAAGGAIASSTRESRRERSLSGRGLRRRRCVKPRASRDPGPGMSAVGHERLSSDEEVRVSTTLNEFCHHTLFAAFVILIQCIVAPLDPPRNLEGTRGARLRDKNAHAADRHRQKSIRLNDVVIDNEGRHAFNLKTALEQ